MSMITFLYQTFYVHIRKIKNKMKSFNKRVLFETHLH